MKKSELPQHNQPVSELLAEQNRAIFYPSISEAINSAPTKSEWKRFSGRFPDRWAGALSTLAKLAGYSDKTETTHNINITLAARLQSARGRDAIDASPASAVVPLTLAAPIGVEQSNRDVGMNTTNMTYTDIPHTDIIDPPTNLGLVNCIEMPRDDAKPTPRIPLTTARNET